MLACGCCSKPPSEELIKQQERNDEIEKLIKKDKSSKPRELNLLLLGKFLAKLSKIISHTFL